MGDPVGELWASNRCDKLPIFHLPKDNAGRKVVAKRFVRRLP